LTVTVEVILTGIRGKWAIVDAIVDAIAIKVPVTGIAYTIPLTIGLLRVGSQWAVVAVRNPVPVGIRITRVAQAITVGVCLIQVGGEGTVICRVEDLIIVIVGITGISNEIEVIIILRGIDLYRAIVVVSSATCSSKVALIGSVSMTAMLPAALSAIT
jgi:hypothetical protein